MIKEAFGESVRQQRRQARLTQEELGQKSDLAPRFIQDIEAGNQQPTITTLFKLAKGLGISPEVLIMPVWEHWEET